MSEDFSLFLSATDDTQDICNELQPDDFIGMRRRRNKEEEKTKPFVLKMFVEKDRKSAETDYEPKCFGC